MGQNNRTPSYMLMIHLHFTEMRGSPYAQLFTVYWLVRIRSVICSKISSPNCFNTLNCIPHPYWNLLKQVSQTILFFSNHSLTVWLADSPSLLPPLHTATGLKVKCSAECDESWIRTLCQLNAHFKPYNQRKVQSLINISCFINFENGGRCNQWMIQCNQLTLSLKLQFRTLT